MITFKEAKRAYHEELFGGSSGNVAEIQTGMRVCVANENIKSFKYVFDGSITYDLSSQDIIIGTVILEYPGTGTPTDPVAGYYTVLYEI
jgi:hypothetical protein